MLPLLSSVRLLPAQKSPPLLVLNTFQKRSVSSPAALATVLPSGLSARCSTLDVCPKRSLTLLSGL